MHDAVAATFPGNHEIRRRRRDGGVAIVRGLRVDSEEERRRCRRWQSRPEEDQRQVGALRHHAAGSGPGECGNEVSIIYIQGDYVGFNTGNG